MFNRIKSKPQKNNNLSRTLFMLLFMTLGIAFSLGNHFVMALTTTTGSTSSSICYVPSAGVAYQCGAGTGTPTPDQPYGNVCTTIPVADQSGNVPTAPPPACNANGLKLDSSETLTLNGENNSQDLYEFQTSTCYLEEVGTSTNNGDPVWVPQNCSSAYFANPFSVNVNIPITADTSDTAVTNCKIGSNTCNLTIKYINPIISFLATLVGIVVVISVVLGGIQYSASGDNPQAAAAAKKRIVTALIAAVAFLFLWGFLEFIIPGGFL